MEFTLSEKLKGINGNLVTEVNDANKDFVTERLSLELKQEQIECSLNIANYRTVNSVKNTIQEVIVALKGERVNPTVIERVKKLFNERL